MPARRRLLVLALTVLMFAPVGCGSEDFDRARDRVRGALRRARRRRPAQSSGVGASASASASRRCWATSSRRSRGREARARGASRGRNEPQEIDAFMEDVLRRHRRLLDADVRGRRPPEPRWASARSRPAAPADGLRHPRRRRGGLLLPGRRHDLRLPAVRRRPLQRGAARPAGRAAGYGRAAGDFAVAYVLAHEYAHNLQQELGVFDNGVEPAAKPFELQADCLAGTWAYSVFEAGLLEPGDLGEDERGARRRRLRRRQRAAPRDAGGAPRRAAHRLPQRRSRALQRVPRKA